ncbi:MAG: S9 family peptidase [Halobacteriales archaeon]
MAAPIPAAALRELTTITEVAIAPDGERAAVVAAEYDATEDERYATLMTVPTDGAGEVHRLSRLADASAPRWRPDGGAIGFLASREADRERAVEGAADGDEEDAEEVDPETQVWLFDLERGGDARQLTDREHGVRAFDWGPAGERLVISARDPTEAQAEYLERREDDGPIELERLQHKADGIGFTDHVTSYLFVVDLGTDEVTRLDGTAGRGAYEAIGGHQPRWQPDGESIAFLTSREDRPDDSPVTDVFTVDATTGAVDRLTDLGYTTNAPRWSPDGRRLAFVGRPAANWYAPTDVFVAADGEVVTLTEGLEATVSWFGFPAFLDDETLLAGFGDAGWTRWYRLPVDGEPEALDAGVDADSSLRVFDVADDTVAFSRTHPAEGHDLFALDVADLDGDAIGRRLTALNAAFFEDHPMPNVARHETVHEGVTVESLLYYPDSFDPDDPRPHPTIVWTHGGPMSYDDPEFAFDHAYFTSRGYLVCKPNYRGSTSYGADFAEVLHGRWNTAEVEDVLAVTDDLVERGVADTDRLFATGLSYGGILTGYLITRTDRFAAAAPEHGIYDLRAEFGTSDSQAWMSAEFGLPWEDPGAYDAASAIVDVGEVETPTLVTAGGEDWRCPPTQAEQLYVSIRKQDVPAKLVIYPNEHHDVGEPERAIHRLETIADWFDRHDPTTESAD